MPDSHCLNIFTARLWTCFASALDLELGIGDTKEQDHSRTIPVRVASVAVAPLRLWRQQWQVYRWQNRGLPQRRRLCSPQPLGQCQRQGCLHTACSLWRLRHCTWMIPGPDPRFYELLISLISPFFWIKLVTVGFCCLELKCWVTQP